MAIEVQFDSARSPEEIFGWAEKENRPITFFITSEGMDKSIFCMEGDLTYVPEL